jgi:DNA-binding transcriptional LysR family regulator
VFTLVDATRLRVFREVATRDSFTAAASALGISQPAVSQHIAKLEQEIGAALLVRTGRSLRITPPGQILLRRTDELLTHLRDISDELAAATGDDGGELRMVTFPSAAATIVPPVVGALRRLAPRATVTLREADPPQSLPALLAGHHDLALAYDYPELNTARDARLQWQVLAEDEMAVALPARHPLATGGPVPLPGLVGEGWVAPHPCTCRDALELACRQAGFAPAVVSETNDYMAMLGLVAAGVGVALVPRLIAAIAVPAGVALRPLAGSRVRRSVAAVTSPNGHRPPLRQKMLHLLQSMILDLARPDLPLSAPAGATTTAGPAARPVRAA